MLFYVQLWRHTLGTPTEKDTYEIGKDFVRIAEVFVDSDNAGRVLVTVQKGDGGEFEVHLKDTAGGWRRLAAFEDRIVQAFFGDRDDLYLISRKDAPRGRLLRTPIKGFELSKARVIVPEGKDTLVSDIWADHPLTVHDGRVYTSWQLGGPSEIRVFDRDGKPLPGPQHLPVSGVGDIVPLPGGDVLFPNTSFVAPVAWFRFSPGASTTKKQAISAKAPVDLSKVTVVREMATSRDGTRVPVNLLFPPGVSPKAGIPFVATGYGGYNISLDPWFDPASAIPLEHGVGLAVANLRGGGEFGEAWHREGSLTKKQNVFDDMIGVLEHLVKQGHAAKGKVAITGASNGGLLMGAVLTQRPDLVNSVTSFVGMYDMLRSETEPNGVFNTTEFGTVKDKAQFEALYAYSPLHKVKDGTDYPPTLFITGANDVRVAPWQSRKMAARMRENPGQKAPVLLLTSFDAGHGQGSSIDRKVSDNADAYTFLLQHLGVKF